MARSAPRPSATATRAAPLMVTCSLVCDEIGARTSMVARACEPATRANEAHEGRNTARIGALKWCERRDSNPHGFLHRILSPARLPVPPLSHGMLLSASCWELPGPVHRIVAGPGAVCNPASGSERAGVTPYLQRRPDCGGPRHPRSPPRRRHRPRGLLSCPGCR